MPQVRVFRHEINSACILAVEAGTNCPQGGDSGHGGRTVLRLADLSGTAMSASINGSAQLEVETLEIILGGDCENDALIEALEFAAKVLRKQTDGLPVKRVEEIDFE